MSQYKNLVSEATSSPLSFEEQILREVEEEAPDTYVDSVKNNRQGLYESLQSVKQNLQKQQSKLREAKLEADYSLRESIENTMTQIDEAEKQVREALRSLEDEHVL